MKTLLVLVFFIFIFPASHAQENPESLKKQCWGGNAGACAKLEALETKRCETIPKDSLRLLYICRSMAQCWGNSKTAIEQANDARMRFGKDSQVYREALENQKRMLLDSCKGWNFSGRAF